MPGKQLSESRGPPRGDLNNSPSVQHNGDSALHGVLSRGLTNVQEYHGVTSRCRWLTERSPKRAVGRIPSEPFGHGHLHVWNGTRATMVNLCTRGHREEMEPLDTATSHFAGFEPQHPLLLTGTTTQA